MVKFCTTISAYCVHAGPRGRHRKRNPCMSEEVTRFKYRLGFRYSASARATNSGRLRPHVVADHRRRSRRLDEFASSVKVQPLAALQTSAAQGSTKNAGEMAAVQIQRAVRGWRARVWAVQVVHDRAWRALVLIQANWRGALVRHGITRHAPATVNIDEDHNKSHCRHYDTSSGNLYPSVDKKMKGLDSKKVRYSTTKRCPERAIWEKCWARVCLGCPSFRDRARVWQVVVELKRSGRGGKMKIANNEAWTALCESSGSMSGAATLLSSEEYLLGKRLQEWGICKIPPYLRLDGTLGAKAAAAGVGPAFSLIASPSMARRGAKARDVFDCVSSVFYSKSSGKTADGGDKTTHNRSSSRQCGDVRTAPTTTEQGGRGGRGGLNCKSQQRKYLESSTSSSVLWREEEITNSSNSGRSPLEPMIATVTVASAARTEDVSRDEGGRRIFCNMNRKRGGGQHLGVVSRNLVGVSCAALPTAKAAVGTTKTITHKTAATTNPNFRTVFSPLQSGRFGVDRDVVAVAHVARNTMQYRYPPMTPVGGGTGVLLRPQSAPSARRVA